MSDNDELVKLRLTFWNGDKKPGDVIEVRPENVNSWRGYAVPANSKAEKAAAEAPAKTVTVDTPKTAKP
jgi:hypothetical protein